MSKQCHTNQLILPIYGVGTSTEKRDAMAMGTKNAHEAQISSILREVNTNNNMRRGIDINIAYRTYVSSTMHDEVGSNKDVKTDAVKLGTNAAYGSHV